MSAGNFKDRTFSPEYNGPDEKTIYEFITMFGTRSQVSIDEAFLQLGPKGRQVIERMISEGKIKEQFRYLSIPGT